MSVCACSSSGGPAATSGSASTSTTGSASAGGSPSTSGTGGTAADPATTRAIAQAYTAFFNPKASLTVAEQNLQHGAVFKAALLAQANNPQAQGGLTARVTSATLLSPNSASVRFDLLSGRETVAVRHTRATPRVRTAGGRSPPRRSASSSSSPDTRRRRATTRRSRPCRTELPDSSRAAADSGAAPHWPPCSRCCS